MSLFDLSQELRNDIMNIGRAVEQKMPRAEVEQMLQSYAQKLDLLDDVFSCNEESSRRSVIDFIDTSIDELSERKKELDTKTLESLSNDIPVYGFELKEGRITRKISSDKKAEQVLSAHFDPQDIHETKLIGIPAIEKLLKSKKLDANEILDQFVVVTHGKPVLVKTTI